MHCMPCLAVCGAIDNEQCAATEHFPCWSQQWLRISVMQLPAVHAHTTQSTTLQHGAPHVLHRR